MVGRPSQADSDARPNTHNVGSADGCGNASCAVTTTLDHDPCADHAARRRGTNRRWLRGVPVQ